MSIFNTLMMAAGGASDAITNGATQVCGTSCNTGTTIPGLIGNISSVLIYLVGAISVVMIIVGGLRYVTSGGDSKATAAAKDTILYAVIGVVVAIIAAAIVRFVVMSVK